MMAMADSRDNGHNFIENTLLKIMQISNEVLGVRYKLVNNIKDNFICIIVRFIRTMDNDAKKIFRVFI